MTSRGFRGGGRPSSGISGSGMGFERSGYWFGNAISGSSFLTIVFGARGRLGLGIEVMAKSSLTVFCFRKKVARLL